MEKLMIPNVEINETKYLGSKYYLAGVHVQLPYWIGYFNNYECTTRIIDGRFYIGIENIKDSNDGYGYSNEQAQAFFYLVENHDILKQEILNSLKDTLPNLLLDTYADYDRINFPKESELVPDFDFKNFIGPSSINIEKDTKDGMAYVSWHFYCLWDTEHGFEVITHKNRVIEIAPEADRFKINEDNGTAVSEETRVETLYNNLSIKKKWWKFW